MLNLFKEELIEEIIKLREENLSLKETQSFIESTNQRLEDLERNQNLSPQYNRRDTVELSGIPLHIPQSQLEQEVKNIFDRAKVQVHGEKLTFSQIQACHCIGKKEKVILGATSSLPLDFDGAW